MAQWCFLKSWCSFHAHTPRYAGWAMFTGWKMDTSLRIYSMASSPLGLGVEATWTMLQVCKCDMKVCNINTKSWEAFADNRMLWKQQVSQGLKRGEAAIWKKMMNDGPGEQPVNSRTTQTHIRHLSSHARAAAEIANPGLASMATQDDAHQWPFMALLHSWMTMTMKY